MIQDPVRRGETLAAFALSTLPALWKELSESAGLPIDAVRHRHEWDCFGLYACVRGLVAAGGFNRESAVAIDALHQHVLEHWAAEYPDAEEPRRAMAAERYAEYGAIGQEGGASGAASVADRLGAACARHIEAAGGPAPAIHGDDLGQLLGGVHEALAEGAAEAVRIAE